MDIFATKHPIGLVAQAQAIAFAIDTDGRVFLIGGAAIPSKGRNAQVFHRADPKSSHEIFMIVVIFVVATLSVEYSDMIVKKGVPIGHRKEVAIELYAQIATPCRALAETIGESL